MTILTCADIDLTNLQNLLSKYNLILHTIEDNKVIPGSWFGDSEAGIIKNNLYIRMDTPVHSALHESCHYICMDPERRQNLHTDAGGDYDEENGVCYLSILLSEYIDGFGQERMFSDMDEWGYTFRLGSSKAWFEDDAEDAFEWLVECKIINNKQNTLWNIRQ
ncbi:MAG: hypothetical protein DIZ80_08600 [endosymbiont of Galathealinum brachiosum]|uniref:Uncharacterized protein n=1 Tax=endosymbiont of Galathealinum brachiosum TaxID=2200906 RepID=A0A370DDW0_9GAMM|nr:MAG: hypothetical protein DIZ80_08600 [endosymbiont of Galathealinum brachiosum]